MLKVELLEYTKNPERVVAAAAKLCYSSSDIEGLLDGLTPEKTQTFIEHLMSLGHESPMEHVSFTFGIEGVSRALLAQITRHRIASYSVKSQRYVNETDFTYVVPPEIEKSPEAKEFFEKSMSESKHNYEKLARILYQKHFDRMVANGMPPKRLKYRRRKRQLRMRVLYCQTPVRLK